MPGYPIRTELAIEAHKVLTRQAPGGIPGVEQQQDFEGAVVTRMRVKDK